MDQPIALSRIEHLLCLASCLRSLASELERNSMIGLTARQVLAGSIQGECVQCGIRVTGEDLMAMIGSGPEKEAKRTRLRQGYCARRGCPSYYYRVCFSELAGVDWQAIVFPAEDASISLNVSADELRPLAGWRWCQQAIRARGLTALAILLALTGMLLALQWYRGGTIPLWREPERFIVDPLPDDEK